MRKLLSSLAISAVVLSSTTEAQQRTPSSPKCAPYERVATELTELHRESVQMFGLMENGHMIQLWGNVDNGAWTIIQVTPVGIACIVAHGEHMEIIPPEVESPFA